MKRNKLIVAAWRHQNGVADSNISIKAWQYQKWRQPAISAKAASMAAEEA